MNKKGMVLILSFIVIVVLSVLGSAIVSRSIHEANIARRYAETAQAFWIADAGVNRALKEIKNNFAVTGSPLWATTLGNGTYSVDVENKTINGVSCKKVTVHGCIPNCTVPNPRAKRSLQTIMEKYIPANFYDNAIYSAGGVDLNGNAFIVANNEAAPDNKAIVYAGDLDVQKPGNITGTTTQDSTISPLAMLDFQWLLNKSTEQHNVYAYVGNKLKNTTTGSQILPTSFWYDEANKIPNVVYIEGNLTLNGNIGTIGGFLVVAGDVLTNPDGEYDATINGNGQVQGLIYTRGDFSVNGGGGGLNVSGGVWTGHEAELNGNANVTYNKTYMDAVAGLGIDASVQIRSWKDQQNPYTLSE